MPPREVDAPGDWVVDDEPGLEDGDSRIVWRPLPDGDVEVRIGPGREQEALRKIADRDGKSFEDVVVTAVRQHVADVRLPAPSRPRARARESKPRRQRVRSSSAASRDGPDDDPDLDPPLACIPVEVFLGELRRALGAS